MLWTGRRDMRVKTGSAGVQTETGATGGDGKTAGNCRRQGCKKGKGALCVCQFAPKTTFCNGSAADEKTTLLVLSIFKAHLLLNKKLF